MVKTATRLTGITAYTGAMVRSASPLIPRVERQHGLIEELRARSPRILTVADLAERLGVSPRTVEWGLAALQAAGLPLARWRGPGGGYGIDARRLLPSVVFTPGEAAALVVALLTVGPYASATAQSALAKLLAVLNEGQPPW